MADVKINVPAGMTEEQVKDLFASFVKQRVETKARDKAVAQATKDLKAAHKAEYDALLAKYLPK